MNALAQFVVVLVLATVIISILAFNPESVQINIAVAALVSVLTLPATRLLAKVYRNNDGKFLSDLVSPLLFFVPLFGGIGANLIILTIGWSKILAVFVFLGVWLGIFILGLSTSE